MDSCLVVDICKINISKAIKKNLNSKHSLKRLHHAKQSATDALKTA